MNELNPKHVEAVLDLINQGPYFRHLSIVIKEVGVGYSLVELTIGNEHRNPFGGLHGGVYASVIDTAAYWAVYGEMDEDAGYITVDMKVDLLSPATSGKIIVKGNRIKMGKTICLAEATAFDETNKPLAHGTSKMMATPGVQTIKAAAEFMAGGALPSKYLVVTV
jgi:uncharacterized protein (TIGR00369 family)